MTPEGRVKNNILAWLRVKRIFAFPVDSVGIFDPIKKVYRKRHSEFHIKGVSDILGIYKGKPLAIEVKSKTGSLTQEQKVFLGLFNELGGIGICARSIDDVEAHLK
jgi:penicillin-binding protein-related factor A (putative recombinase)